MPRSLTTLTLNDARQLIAAATAKAEQLGVPYNIAVVDAGGALVVPVEVGGGVNIPSPPTAPRGGRMAKPASMLSGDGPSTYGSLWSWQRNS